MQVGVGGGMKSGVAFWRALRDVRDIHPCWAHLNGIPLKEHDLPRPISTEYKSVFTAEPEQQQQQQQQVRRPTVQDVCHSCFQHCPATGRHCMHTAFVFTNSMLLSTPSVMIPPP
jgi:hypothetical protein